MGRASWTQMLSWTMCLTEVVAVVALDSSARRYSQIQIKRRIPYPTGLCVHAAPEGTEKVFSDTTEGPHAPCASIAPSCTQAAAGVAPTRPAELS